MKSVRDSLSNSGDAAKLVDRQDFLSGVTEEGTVLTVAEFLRHWGADTRPQSVTDEIDVDLQNNDLITTPNYLSVAIHDTILLQRKGLTSDGDPSSKEPESRTADLQDIGITVGNLPSSRKAVKSISQNGTIQQAITEMSLDGFSQIAVISGPRSVKGAVTWQSIARARNRKPDAKLSDAIVEVPFVYFDKPLIDVLPELQANDFVFVKDIDGTLAGIVTNADVVDAYRSFSTPYLLIGELDQILRRIISEAIEPEKIWSVCEPTKEVQIELPQMTMHDYQRLLEDDQIWSTLNWPIDKRALLKRLDELRKVRNDVMHFNRDAIPDDQIAIFREAIRLIKELTND